MASIGERLKEERDRLGINQTEFAALAGASKETQINWERGKGGAPNAFDLERFSEAGVDVLYVVTGRRATISQAPPIDTEVLRQVIEGVEEILTTSRRKADPTKKAEAIALLYEHFKMAGRVERGFIERQLRLVA